MKFTLWYNRRAAALAAYCSISFQYDKIIFQNKGQDKTVHDMFGLLKMGIVDFQCSFDGDYQHQGTRDTFEGYINHIIFFKIECQIPTKVRDTTPTKTASNNGRAFFPHTVTITEADRL